VEEVGMTNLSDFKLPDGGYDWDAYHKAQRANGDICFKCGSYILYASGHLDMCNGCKDFGDDDGEVTHDSFIRCPKCRHSVSVSDSENYELYEDGEHAVSCTSCDHDFTVSTNISYTFTSPAMGDDGEDDE
jgi:uncharacterized C2H2 Zn-finger protein